MGYCLPACGEMALAQLGIQASQARLAQAFGTRAGVGTPFSRIKRLAQWQVNVQVTEWDGLQALVAALENGASVIAAVTTTPGLPGWGQIRSQHTILVVEIGSDYVSYHDPSLAYGPVSAL